MAFVMALPRKHPITGVYEFRRSVPEALRPLIGKREWKRTLKTKDAAQAKKNYIPEAAKFEAAMAHARLRLKIGGTKLSPREIAALSAE